MAHRQGRHVVSRLQERRHRLFDGATGAADHGLLVAIVVCDHHVPVDGLQNPLDLRERGEHSRHPAVIRHRDARHLAAAGADRFERVGERQGPGGDQRAVLAQTVPHGHIGPYAVSIQQTGEGQIGGEHRRLGNRGLAQVLFGARHCAGIRRIDKDVLAQRLAEEGRHHLVGLFEGACHDRFCRAQAAQHVDVLRSLAGIQKRYLRGGPMAAEDALRAQRLPDRGLVGRQRFEGS